LPGGEGSAVTESATKSIRYFAQVGASAIGVRRAAMLMNSREREGTPPLDRLVGQSRVRLGIATRTHRTSAAAIRAPALKVRATSAGRD